MSIKWELIEYGNLQGQDDETYGPIYEIVVLPDGRCELWFALCSLIGTYASIRAAMAAAEVQPENFLYDDEAGEGEGRAR
jgi:hypothetical protein